MNRIAGAGALLLLGVVMAACGSSSSTSDGSPLCDAGQLSSALSAAGAGDTVRVGACRVTGSFHVPAGVHLVGAGATSVIVASGGAGVAIAASQAEASVSDLAIESEGIAGILGTGNGAIAIERVDVRATGGIGIGIEGASALRLTDVKLIGQKTATHGLVVRAGTDATLTNVSVSGFAQIGALFHETPAVKWTGGSASDNPGSGIWVQKSTSFTMSGTSLERNHYAALVIIETPTVDVKDCKIADNALGKKPAGSTGADQLGDGLQLVLSSKTIKFENATFTNNARAGIQLELGAVDEMDAGLTWKNVTAESTGMAYGARCQGIETWGPTDKWHTGIVAKGAAIVNDGLNLSTTSGDPTVRAGIIGPPYIPSAVALSALGR